MGYSAGPFCPPPVCTGLVIDDTEERRCVSPKRLIEFDSIFFGLQATKRIIPCLTKLGISNPYAYPIFKARQGGLHNYDVVYPDQLA
jgi:hypothetical protein